VKSKYYSVCVIGRNALHEFKIYLADKNIQNDPR